MAEPFIVYGASASGSVPIEATLTLLNLPYRVEEHAPWEGKQEANRLARINPLRQVPALALPTGELMTESAAILIWLADAYPDGRLAPGVTDPARPAFLRWMTFVSAAIYALYWIADDPSRIVEREEDHAAVKARLFERIAHCWARMGASCARADTFSATTCRCSTSMWQRRRAGLPVGGASTRLQRGSRKPCAASTPIPGWRPCGPNASPSRPAGSASPLRFGSLKPVNKAAGFPLDLPPQARSKHRCRLQ